MRDILILCGPPGSGKGSIAPCIAEERGIAHLSTGDMLRDAVSRGTEVGKAVDQIMKDGGLVSDDIVIAIIEDRIKQKDCAKGFILDGFPRTLQQAKELDAMLLKTRELVFTVIELQVDSKILEERICGRWIHKNSGRSYHVKYVPPKSYSPGDTPTADTMRDDDTGEPLYQRADDTAKALMTRLVAFFKETAPILKHYDQKKIVKKVNAGKAPDEIWRDVQKILTLPEVPIETNAQEAATRVYTTPSGLQRTDPFVEAKNRFGLPFVQLDAGKWSSRPSVC